MLKKIMLALVLGLLVAGCQGPGGPTACESIDAASQKVNEQTIISDDWVRSEINDDFTEMRQQNNCPGYENSGGGGDD